MALIAYTYIDIDVNRTYSDLALIIAKQYDSGRGVCASLYSDGELLDPTGVTCQIYILKPDGTKVYQQFTVNNKRIYMTLTNTTLSVPGVLEAEIVYTLGNNKVTSPIFNIVVYPTNIDSSAIESQDEFTALEQAISTLSNYDHRLTVAEGKIDIHTSAIQNLTAWRDTARTDISGNTNAIKSLQNHTHVNIMPWPMREITGTEIVKDNIHTSTVGLSNDGRPAVKFYKDNTVALSNDVIFYLTEDNYTLPEGTYTLSGCPEGAKDGDDVKWVLAVNIVHQDGTNTSHGDVGNGTTFDVVSGDKVHVYIRFYASVLKTSSFETGYFRVMIEVGDTAHDYVGPWNTSSRTLVNALTEKFRDIDVKIAQLDARVSALENQ